jgi:hypothetical protein
MFNLHDLWRFRVGMGVRVPVSDGYRLSVCMGGRGLMVLALLGTFGLADEACVEDVTEGKVASQRSSSGGASSDLVLRAPESSAVAAVDLESGKSHPLRPLLAMARDGLRFVEEHVQDYTCELLKREMVDGHLLPQEVIFAKVRHGQPGSLADDLPECDSIYLRFQSPAQLAGRELLFNKSAEPDQRLLVRNGGRRLAFVTLELPVDCALAMQGNRYPVTEFGIKRLLERMIALGERELAYDECEVDVTYRVCEGVECQVIEVRHPERRPHFTYHLARIFVDLEQQLPVRFEAYDWPTEAGQPPVMIEEYQYKNIQLNVGLTDADFDRKNKQYQFR